MNITFFFPYHQISGIPVCFSNLVNYFVRTCNYELNVIDYHDGALIRSCKPSPKINFIEFRDFEDCYINFETYLVVQAGLPSRLRRELKLCQKVKVLQWAAHEANLIPYLSKFGVIANYQRKSLLLHKALYILDRSAYRNLSRWIGMMIERGAIVFMTESIFQSTIKYLFLTNIKSPTYLPNFSYGENTYDHDLIIAKSKSVTTKLNLCWVGRIADFKVHILNYSLRKIAEYARRNSINIRFHIIGVGICQDYLQVDVENEFFEVIEVGELEKSEVDYYLERNIDAMFCMGTSALDGAKIGLPVVLLDQSYVEIEEGYIFKSLFDSAGFDLGHPVSTVDFDAGNRTLDFILDEFRFNYLEMSRKTRDYFLQNHSIDTVAAKFLAALEDGACSLDETGFILSRPRFLRRLYLSYLTHIRKSYY